ncbi:uncharacterized protein LOC120624641 [Pararge aegeria]|uniref:Jg21287 protein n=1 Tax=Pararge aegeria aegeria TaxID=348720 RepID=A0A8S4SBL7_9NEOP|nr:uncharacterized protein LOC120624641 [Pararge aegeria]CAH2264556.1 jg21287 [Pararge aegeria aegeria]
MDENIDNNVAVLAILDNQSSPYEQNLNITNYDQSHQINQEEIETSETSKQNIIWTKNATLMLLNLYETKLNVLDNPKKKSKMWISMAEELKSFHIEVTPDQVRWKINALTKKYKDCIDNGQGSVVFKYFNEMHQILGRYNEDSGAYRLASGVIQGPEVGKNLIAPCRKISFKNTTPFRKLRAERRAKVEIDKQWIDYIKRHEEQKQIRDERYERSLRLREEELQLKKKELEIKQSIALRKLELREKRQEEILKIEREKCALLRKLLNDH